MKIFILSVLLISFFSCQHKEDSHSQHAHTNSTHKSESHNESEQHGLVLNGQEKWLANAETTAGIKKMVHRIEAFTATEDISVYHTLQKELQKDFSFIIQKCTMDGAAHDNLHTFLMPLQSAFKQLKSPKIESCKKAITQIEAQLKLYNQYFK